MTLIADGFLAGSLLTLLIPVLLLVALVFWYVKFIARVPETAEGEAADAGQAANLGPTTNLATAANPDPAVGHRPATASEAGQTPRER